MITLTYTEPLFANYAFYVALITLKLISMSALTSVVRLINMTFANEEDAAVFNKRINLKDPLVERIRRAHLNDLENIPAFWIIGFLYTLSYPNVFIATMCFRVYTVSRFIHTISYLLGIGRPRGLSYVVGLVVLTFMTLNVIVALL
ncbi:UNVERIFIED_CONTAM: hypothetical protein RMT77_007811 [Armadillidium vulgare]